VTGSGGSSHGVKAPEDVVVASGRWVTADQSSGFFVLCGVRGILSVLGEHLPALAVCSVRVYDLRPPTVQLLSLSL